MGRVTPSGQIAQFSPEASEECGGTCGVGDPVTGADGNVWFPEIGGGGVHGKIGRITPSGAITSFNLGVLSHVQDLALGPDGNMWFPDIGGSEATQPNTPRQNAIGRITAKGSIVEFAAGLRPVAYSQGNPLPHGLVSGPDRDVWFIDGAAIGRITTTEEPSPSPRGGSGGGGSVSTARGGGLGVTSTKVSPAQIAALLRREITPVGKGARIATLLRAHGFTITFKALEAGRAVIDWYQLPPGANLAKKPRAKPILVASGKMNFSTAGTKKIKINLTTVGKRLLKNIKSLKLTAKGVFTPVGKTAVTVTKAFVLQR
jgi:hypothetical protein